MAFDIVLSEDKVKQKLPSVVPFSHDVGAGVLSDNNMGNLFFFSDQIFHLLHLEFLFDGFLSLLQPLY